MELTTLQQEKLKDAITKLIEEGMPELDFWQEVYVIAAVAIAQLQGDSK